MLKIAAIALVLSWISSSSLAQTRRPAPSPVTQPTSSTSSRTAAREQALADLDDASPIARLGALEDILGGTDAILTELALKKVFASSDQEMKSVAIRKILSEPKREFIFEIAQCGYNDNRNQDDTNNGCHYALGRLSGAIPIYFMSFNASSGEFGAYSTYSVKNNQGFIAIPGKVQGLTVAFGINLQGRIGEGEQCRTRLQLTLAGTLKGQLQCDKLLLAGDINLF